MVSKYLCNSGKYSRFICDLHTDKELVLHLTKFLDRQIFIAGTTDPSRTAISDISYHINHIAHYGTGCRKFTCTPSVKHGIIHCISMNKNCIERIPYRSKWMLFPDHHRIDSDLDSIFCIMCNTQKLDDAVKFLCICNIPCRNLRNSFCMYIKEYNSGMKCDGCHDRHFSSRIQTFHVRSRVCLCKSKFLCLFQCICKIHSLFCHLGKDIIGRTVHNPNYL